MVVKKTLSGNTLARPAGLFGPLGALPFKHNLWQSLDITIKGRSFCLCFLIRVVM